MSDDELRLYCVMRVDLEMPPGKAIVQGGHAFCTVLHRADPALVAAYFEADQPKITKRAKSLHVIARAAQECEAIGLNHYVVTDAGRTVFSGPTVTCLGIGPVRRADLPRYVEKLQNMNPLDLTLSPLG